MRLKFTETYTKIINQKQFKCLFLSNVQSNSKPVYNPRFYYNRVVWYTLMLFLLFLFLFFFNFLRISCLQVILTFIPEGMLTTLT